MNKLKRFTLLAGLLTLMGCRDEMPPAQPYVKVYKSDGAIQCEFAGIPPQEMATELTAAGIDVICFFKGDSGLAVTAVCGAGGTGINVYQINSTNLPDALELGFQPVSELPGYQDQACD